MATIVAAAGGGNWNSTSTWQGGQIPTAADDVQLSSSSGNVTVTAGALCRSLDCAGYGATLTHSAGTTLTVGDSTAGAGGVALRLSAGMTYTLGNSATSAVTFVSTDASPQTIDPAGKAFGNFTINAPGASYLLASPLATGPAATVTLTAGTFDTGSQTCSWGLFSSSGAGTRALTLGTSIVTLSAGGGLTAWTCATPTNLSLSAASSTVVFAADAGMNCGANLAYGTIVFGGAGLASITASGGVGTGTITNLTRTGTAGKTDSLQLNTSFVVTGVFTVTGNSATNRVLVCSNVIGSVRTLTVNGSVSVANADFADITAAGSASWDLSAVSGGSGDCGGNTHITFSASVPQTWSGTTGGNWSANPWTTRVPLPQDDVAMSTAFDPAQTVTMDMPRLGRSVDWTGASGAPTWAAAATPSTIYGSLTLASGMTVGGAATPLNLRGRGSWTVTTNGVAFPAGVVIDAGGTGNTYTLQDPFSITGGTLAVGSSPNRGGTLNTNGQAVTCPSITVGNASGNSTLILGASAVSLTSTAAGAVFTVAGGTTNALNAGTSTLTVAAASSNDRNIVAHGFVLNAVRYTAAGSTGRLIFGTTGATGTVTVADLGASDASAVRSVRVWAGTTLAVGSVFNVNGAAGRLAVVDSSSSGVAATVRKLSGVVSCDYLSVKDCAATGGARWYAGANTTHAGGNSGWVFGAAPTVVNSGAFFGFLNDLI